MARTNLQFIKNQLLEFKYVAVLGDFNIAPEDIDVHDPIKWQHSVLVSQPERDAFQSMLQLGLIDSFRKRCPTDDKLYSWWDYRAGSFRRDHGLRIDHILLNEVLYQHCTDCGIDKEARKHERPSDHAPYGYV